MTNSSNNISIYCDGGSRGNPGPAACAFVVYSGEELVHSKGTYLGVTTNNQAEYQAVLEALKYLSISDPKLSILNFYLDSLLVVNQLKGIYKIKDQNLKIKNIEIKKVINNSQFSIINYHHIPREKNSVADLLVNQTLDQNI